MDSELLKSLVGLGGIPLILGLTQLFKPWVKDTRWYAPISVLLGVAINLGLGEVGGADFITAIFLGIIAGLGASGLYSAGATMREGTMANKANRDRLPPSPAGRGLRQ